MSKNVIWVSPEVYERILNNPDEIIIEAQGEDPIVLKVIGFPRWYKKSRRLSNGFISNNEILNSRKNDIDFGPPRKVFGAP